MLSIDGASLDEVWGSPIGRNTSQKPKAKSGGSRKGGPRKYYDNIMDAYLNDFDSSCIVNDEQPRNAFEGQQQMREVNVLPGQDFYDVSPYFPGKQEHDFNPIKPSKCNNAVQPVESSDFTEDAMEYNRFFKEDNMFKGRGDTSVGVPEEASGNVVSGVPEEHVTYGVSQEYTNPHDYYHYQHQAATTTAQSQYIELALYLFSGLILIFMMEQILRLGLYLR